MNFTLILVTNPFIFGLSLFVLGLEQKFQTITHHQSQPELLEGSTSLATKGPFSDPNGINDHCSSSSELRQRPYLEFFTTSHSISIFSKNSRITKLAQKIVELTKSLVPSLESWEIFFERNELLVTDCLELAEKALQSNNDFNESERLWVVGIVAALSLPDHLKGTISERSIGFYHWSPQVFLEIQATQRYEPFMTAKFMSIWLDGKPLPRDNEELNEGLKRAELFGKLMKGSSQKIPAKIIHIQLLKLELPTNQSEIEKMINHFRSNFKNGTVLDRNVFVLGSLFQHLLEHSSQIRATIQQHIQDYDFFKDINRPYAQKDLLDVLKNPASPKSILNFSEILRQVVMGMNLNKIHSIEFIVYTILDIFAKGESVYEKEQIQLSHKVLLAFCFMVPSAEEYLIDHFIEKEANVPEYLTHVWVEYEQIKCSSRGLISDYSCLFFIRNPSYLKDARCQLSAQNMLQSKSDLVKEMGSFLKLLPRSSGREIYLDNQLHQSIYKEYDKVESTLQKVLGTAHMVEAHLEMCFEFLFHLTEHKEIWKEILLNRIHDKLEFREVMVSGARKLLTTNRESWKQTPKSYHVNKDILHAFVRRILFYCNQLWEETTPWNGHPSHLIKNPRWLNQDKPITINLFGQNFLLQEVNTSSGKKGT